MPVHCSSPASISDLTQEQRLIVAHNEGPALVFAVAGSGKTTSVAHRIERLTRERVFAAPRILATTFSRRGVEDFRGKLRQWPSCRTVKVKTLHSLGYSIMQKAMSLGYLNAQVLNDGEDDASSLDRKLAFSAVRIAREQRVAYAQELDQLDTDDFLNYIGVCKANLRYADLAAERLPDEALQVATQARPPDGVRSLDWYLDLYQLYEKVRRSMNAVTYDDMMVSGWELLVRYPTVMAECAGDYDCVIVDEYQDVNLAQAETLDLLTRGHRNYMAIGDEDQTIYEWRGASPHYILDFTERFGAREYFIQDNFRCQASHVLLANEVIRHNRKRRDKHLSLTRGFGGATTLEITDSDEAAAQRLIEEVRLARREGRSLSEMVVLLRIYAQTAYIEAGLITQGIPYKVVGASPFYDRGEVKTLLAYLRLAVYDRALLERKALSAREKKEIGELWASVYNRPRRYLRKAWAKAVLERTIYDSRPLTHVLGLEAASADAREGTRIVDLADLLEGLGRTLNTRPAADALRELVDRLKYRDFLKDTSGFEATAREKIATVDALLSWARDKGTVREFLEYTDHLRNLQGPHDGERDVLALMTVHRAKGLEWPLVFLPGCNTGIHPCIASNGEPAPGALEEERRLFYVAVTRAKEELHLYALKSQPLSRFLQEAGYDELQKRLFAVKSALDRPLADWTTADALMLALCQTPLRLNRYLQAWWHMRETEERALAVAQRMQGLFAVAERKGYLQALGLHQADAAVWEVFGPLEEEPGEDDFADLNEFLPAPVPDDPFPKRVAQGLSAGKPFAEPVALFAPGDRVRHPTFGPGAIQRVEHDADNVMYYVLFDREGPKKLMERYARLVPADDNGRILS